MEAGKKGISSDKGWTAVYVEGLKEINRAGGTRAGQKTRLKRTRSTTV